MGLTTKQRAFIDEYLIDYNATQAAIRAGYSEKTAYSAGSRMLKKDVIKSRIDERFSEKQKDHDLTPLPQRRKHKRSSILYLIRESLTNATKIGIASNLESRLSSLQTGSVQELSVLAYFPIKGAKTQENHLHQRYAHKHVRGEWFDLSDDDIETICNYLGGFVVVDDSPKVYKQQELL